MITFYSFPSPLEGEGGALAPDEGAAKSKHLTQLTYPSAALRAPSPSRAEG